MRWQQRLHSPYDRSKALGEQLVQAAVAEGLDAIIVNPTGVIGSRDFGPSFFGTALLDLAQGTLPGLVGGGCDWVDVRDLVAGVLDAEQHAAPGAKYLLSGHWAALSALAEVIAEFTGVPVDRQADAVHVSRYARTERQPPDQSCSRCC
ncbi:MAG: NAD-dependent epimerase/dehydratase family protein [Anaerolineae bacterium]|nr:NAD-dependent epimerase/dehydratase family protein [Anaerolineae bacterium]